ncbi:MAG: ABC transporter substrate-binding protein [Bifidobacterium sp.]|nr:ABC transporter substrate-binding protein [Bifidobacterium sp.]
MVRAVALASSLAMCIGALAGCGSTGASEDGKGQVYYLNSKPEVVKQVKELGNEYTKATGVKVTVESATADSYDSTLTSELSKSNAPTMFNLSSFPTFIKVKSYLKPLNDTKEYKLLNEEGKKAAIQENGKAYSLPYVSEYITILYNKKILRQYCAKPYALIKGVEDIKNYGVLASVVKDMQKHKGDLGLDGAWTTPGLDPSDAYRIAGHPADVMIVKEYLNAHKTFMPKISGKYMKYYKNFVDLQLQNSPTPADQVGSKNVDDCVSEFSLGKTAFLNSGSWANTQIDTSTMNPKDIGVLPYWMGIPGEEKYGVPASHEMQWSVNRKSSEEDQKATLKFINWCVTSAKGKEIMSKEMGFSVPFSTFGEKDQPTTNPIITEVKKLSKTKPTVPALITPSSKFSKDIENALIEYAQGTGKWDGVSNAIVNGWATEWQLVKEQNGVLPQYGLE